MDRVGLKNSAKLQLSGKTLLFFLCILIASAIMTAIGGMTFFLGSLGAVIIAGPMMYGIAHISRSIYRNEDVKIENLFIGFKESALNSILNSVLVTLFTFLWTLLFIIPGIVMGIAYSMSMYIQIDNPEMSATDCIRESKELMRGHKMDFFVLTLSFLGWFLLSALTFGILLIWVLPYFEQTKFNFYQSIKPILLAPDAAAIDAPIIDDAKGDDLKF